MPLKAKIQEGLIGMLEKRYTGIREVVALLDKVRERVEKQRIAGMHQDQGSSDVKDKKTGSNGSMIETTEDGDILIGYGGSSEQVDGWSSTTSLPFGAPQASRLRDSAITSRPSVMGRRPFLEWKRSPRTLFYWT